MAVARAGSAYRMETEFFIEFMYSFVGRSSDGWESKLFTHSQSGVCPRSAGREDTCTFNYILS